MVLSKVLPDHLFTNSRMLLSDMQLTAQEPSSLVENQDVLLPPLAPGSFLPSLTHRTGPVSSGHSGSLGGVALFLNPCHHP